MSSIGTNEEAAPSSSNTDIITDNIKKLCNGDTVNKFKIDEIKDMARHLKITISQNKPELISAIKEKYTLSNPTNANTINTASAKEKVNKKRSKPDSQETTSGHAAYASVIVPITAPTTISSSVPNTNGAINTTSTVTSATVPTTNTTYPVTFTNALSSLNELEKRQMLQLDLERAQQLINMLKDPATCQILGNEWVQLATIEVRKLTGVISTSTNFLPFHFQGVSQGDPRSRVGYF